MRIELPQRGEHLQSGLELHAALERGEAEGILFKNQLISGEVFDEMELRGCVLQNCRILGGRISGFSVWDCSFYSCDFSNCVMEDAYFQRTEFFGCKLNGSTAISAVMKDVYLEDCSCKQWNISNATMKAVAWNHCDCTAAIFSMWKRKELSFYETRLSGCNFFHTELKNIDLSTCTIDGLMISGEELRGASIAAEQSQDLVGLLGVKIK